MSSNRVDDLIHEVLERIIPKAHSFFLVQAASFLLDKRTHHEACASLARKGRQTVRESLTGGSLQKLYDMPSPVATQLPANLSLDDFSDELAQLDESDLCAVLRKSHLYEIVYLQNAARMRAAALAARFSEGTLDLEVRVSGVSVYFASLFILCPFLAHDIFAKILYLVAPEENYSQCIFDDIVSRDRDRFIGEKCKLSRFRAKLYLQSR